MMKKGLITVLALGALLALAGLACDRQDSAPQGQVGTQTMPVPGQQVRETEVVTLPVPLNDTSWVLATLNGQALLPDQPITLNLESGRIYGTDGCNSYSTSYTVDGVKFRASKNMISTSMACAQPIMLQASAYIAALTQAAAYKSDGQQLTLLDSNGKALATFTAQSRKLGETSWVLTGYNNGKQAVVSVVLGTKITADFSADGRLSGSAGCNNYTAAYEISDKTIKIGPAASTRKMCAEPAGVMEQESQYLKALATASSYRVEANTLELRTAEGALVATFEKSR